ncbi:LacI family DNA-binding transcriptional regulator [Paenibacillus luteus]|uniref:LacI family DNA-binding transcriptional regulator n=1 Tax=Paenibacillus luteus TaxID=2545753 RepID=UPI0011439ABC|nr:LacI family DNA-binding transcriptional regulator [Paenibacillus luteus]
MVKRNQTVGVKQIAEALGVSSSTVSMVLNNRGGEFRIADTTCERIIQTANELGYRHEARMKRKKRSFNRTLVCAFCPPDFDKGPTSQFYAGINRYLNELNLKYETIVFPYELGKLKDKISFISKEFISGAIMMALTEEDIAFIENTKFDIPVVLFNRTAKGYSSVLTDDYTVGHSAMEHFIRRGHTRFGIVSPNYSSRALSLRSTGYRDKLRSSGMEADEAYSFTTTYGDASDAGGYAAMEEMLQSEKLPTALFVSIDNMMSGVTRRVRERGIRVPEDLEIISYGSMAFNNIVSPTITSFVPSSEEMSYNCAKLLHRFIEDGVWNDNVKMSFEATCVYRESCPE